jgi:hypothetical protein
VVESCHSPPPKQTITAACDIRTLASLALLIARSQLPVEL